MPTAGRPAGRAPGLVHWLYLPWVVLVYVPLLVVYTAFCGSVASLVALVSPNLGFWCGVIWSRLILWTNFTRVEVVGMENVAPGQAYVIMSNHRSVYDIFAFYGHFTRQFRWVMKQELRKIPFLGRACVNIGCVFIDRSNRERAIEQLSRAGGLFERGISLMIFPEGTRSRTGEMLPFKKGGFMVALASGLPILPVTIEGTDRIQTADSLWIRPGKVELIVHPPIPVDGYTVDTRDELVAKVREVISAPLSKGLEG